jgi:hypothetical protein
MVAGHIVFKSRVMAMHKLYAKISIFFMSVIIISHTE